MHYINRMRDQIFPSPSPVFVISLINPFLGRGSEGPMTYAFTHRGNFSFSFFSSSVYPLQSSYPGPEAQIPALRPESSS